MENHKGLNDIEKQLRQHPGRSCFYYHDCWDLLSGRERSLWFLYSEGVMPYEFLNLRQKYPVLSDLV